MAALLLAHCFEKKILDKQDDIIMGEKSKKEINMEKLNRALMR